MLPREEPIQGPLPLDRGAERLTALRRIYPKSGRAASEEARRRPLFERAAREFGRRRADGEVARLLEAPILTHRTLVRLPPRAWRSRGQTQRTPTDKGETRV